MDIPIQSFGSLDEISKHNSADNCYIVVDKIVFDLSNAISDSTVLSEADCGKDVTSRVDIQSFTQEHTDTYIGYLEDILSFDDVSEIEEKIAKEKAVYDVSQDEVEKESSSSFLIVSILVLLILVGVGVVMFLKKKKTA